MKKLLDQTVFNLLFWLALGALAIMGGLTYVWWIYLCWWWTWPLWVKVVVGVIGVAIWYACHLRAMRYWEHYSVLKSYQMVYSIFTNGKEE